MPVTFIRAWTTLHTRSCLFQHKLLDFVVLRTTGYVFLLLLSSLLQKHKTCRPQSNKIKQFVLEKVRQAEGQRAGLDWSISRKLVQHSSSSSCSSALTSQFRQVLLCICDLCGSIKVPHSHPFPHGQQLGSNVSRTRHQSSHF